MHADLALFKESASEFMVQGRPFFDPDQEISFARAPGRLDVMGGIADYSGSLVLEMPIAEATLAAVQPNQTQTVEIIS
ncbi:MAG: galactokinase family protein, partial [Anaerolineae bacterium]